LFNSDKPEINLVVLFVYIFQDVLLLPVVLLQLCDVFWNLRTHVGRQALRKNTKKYLEHVQRGALHVMFGNTPYDKARCASSLAFCS